MLETGVLLHAEQKNLKASVPIGYLYYSGKTSSPQGAKIFGAPLQPSRQNGTAPLSRGEKRDMLDTSETEKGRTYMQTIGFIGTGIMGQGMIRNLMKAGYPVQIYNRTRSKAEALEREGAVWKDSAAQCAAGCGVVITIVGYPQDVEEVYFGPGGLLESAQPGTVLIDMTTTSPKLAQRIYDQARERGLDALDAPVSGGNTGAANGTLAIMAGGDEAVFQKVLPVLETMGENIVLEGGPGAGQHTKMANQIAIAGALAEVCEALTYAKRAGLDPARVYETIRTGAARSGQLDIIAPKVLNGDFSAAFYLRHFVKDMGIASQECRDRGLELEVLEQVLADCRQIEAEGHGGEGTQALIRHYPWAD